MIILNKKHLIFHIDKNIHSWEICCRGREVAGMFAYCTDRSGKAKDETPCRRHNKRKLKHIIQPARW